MKHKTLHMIGNAHIDLVWLWLWQEGFQEVKASFRSALDRMKEYEFFVFTCSSAAMYDWVEHNDPAMFEEIKQRIKEGRWVIVGGWWIQPDCNIPGGESYIRQGLLGQRYFLEKFNVAATVGYNVDSFGHHGMLPQILRKSGMDSYVFMRPMPHEKSLPGSLFWWESDDGSKVIAFRIIHKYETWGKELEQGIYRNAEQLIGPVDNLMMFYGVGNHGGGPTIENINSIVALQEQPDLPTLKFSSPNDFFQTIREKQLFLPTVHDDLQHHASGCYAAHAKIKQWNRQAENKMAIAETFSTIASVMHMHPYPLDYERAWKNILFNQFHDILAGTSIREAYDDARNEYGEALAIASRGLNSALQSLSWNINIAKEEGMKPIVVFNNHSWSAPMVINLELGAMGKDIMLLDEMGRQIAVQAGRASSTTADVNGRFSYTFVDELPAMGYKVYRAYSKQTSTYMDMPVIQSEWMKAEPFTLENDRLKVMFDEQTGWITSLIDKQMGAQLIAKPATQPIVIEDMSDTWSHGILRYEQVIGEFKTKEIKQVDNGPVKSTISVKSEYGHSTMIQEYSMYRDLDYIEVKVKLNWQEQHKMLKLLFPFNLTGIKPTYEIPYGSIVRESNGEEEPMHSWVDYSGYLLDKDVSYGVSIINDGQYSCSMNGNTIGLTVLRSPIYAHHIPAIPEIGEQYDYMDQGIHRFSYALFPHQGSWEKAGTIQRALEFNQRPVTVVESYHEGELAQKFSFMQIDQPNIVVCALKRAEEDNGYVLRCREVIKQRTEAKIELLALNRVIAVTFAPSEIKTFFIPDDLHQHIIETDMIERPIE